MPDRTTRDHVIETLLILAAALAAWCVAMSLCGGFEAFRAPRGSLREPCEILYCRGHQTPPEPDH